MLGGEEKNEKTMSNNGNLWKIIRLKNYALSD